MNVRKHILAVICLSLIIFSSCKKDVIVNGDPVLTSDVLSSNVTANDVIETVPPVYTGVSTSINANCGGFYQSVPARYNLTTKAYPLIIFLHGSGEIGNGVSDLKKMNCCGIPFHLNRKTFPADFLVNGLHHSFIVMSPQFKARPKPADVQAVIAYATKRFRVDPTRVYVTGLSMGGGATWDYAGAYGQTAAAIVPVCGGSSPTATLTKNIALKNLPAYALHANDDVVVPAQWSKDFITKIKTSNPAISPKLKLTIWPTGGHNGAWIKAFNPITKVDGKSIYEWMLVYKR